MTGSGRKIQWNWTNCSFEAILEESQILDSTWKAFSVSSFLILQPRAKLQKPFLQQFLLGWINSSSSSIGDININFLAPGVALICSFYSDFLFGSNTSLSLLLSWVTSCVMDWIFVSTCSNLIPQIHRWKSNLQCEGVWRWSLWERIRSGRWSPHGRN